MEARLQKTSEHLGGQSQVGQKSWRLYINPLCFTCGTNKLNIPRFGLKKWTRFFFATALCFTSGTKHIEPSPLQGRGASRPLAAMRKAGQRDTLGHRLNGGPGRFLSLNRGRFDLFKSQNQKAKGVDITNLQYLRDLRLYPQPLAMNVHVALKTAGSFCRRPPLWSPLPMGFSLGQTQTASAKWKPLKPAGTRLVLAPHPRLENEYITQESSLCTLLLKKKRL